MADEERVREINARFYDAINRRDIDEMDRVWEADNAAASVCVHPGREAIVGYDLIRNSLEAIFSASESMSIESVGEHVTVVGDAAWIVCTEVISMEVESDLMAASAQATNIFKRTAGSQWRMMVHHASPIAFGVPEEWPDAVN